MPEAHLDSLSRIHPFVRFRCCPWPSRCHCQRVNPVAAAGFSLNNKTQFHWNIMDTYLCSNYNSCETFSMCHFELYRFSAPGERESEKDMKSFGAGVRSFCNTLTHFVFNFHHAAATIPRNSTRFHSDAYVNMERMSMNHEENSLLCWARQTMAHAVHCSNRRLDNYYETNECVWFSFDATEWKWRCALHRKHKINCIPLLPPANDERRKIYHEMMSIAKREILMIFQSLAN